MTGYDGFKRILGTTIHVAVDCNSLPISLIIHPANNHDSAKLVDVMQNIDDPLYSNMMLQIKKVCADKGYDAKHIRDYLAKRNVLSMIPKRSYKTKCNSIGNYKNYNKTRYVVERFLAWLKCGFRRVVIRYERIAENYLALINIAAFLMYCRVLG